MKTRLSRRGLLRALGIGAAFLPIVASGETPAQAQATGARKRLVTVTWGNGLVPEDFYPSGNEITIGETLKSLEPWKDKLIIIEGLDLKVMSDYSERKWDGHFTYPTLLTGSCDAGFETREAKNASIDQFIADELLKKGVKTQLPNIYMGVRTSGDSSPSSWKGENQPNTPETNPQRLFDKLFAGVGMPVEMVDSLRERRASVLDYVGKDLEAFGANLGTEDKFKVQAHLQSIREIEMRLSGGTGPTAECKPPTLSDGTDTPAQMKNVFDLTAAALICDATRVVNIEMYTDGGADGNSFSWLGINRDYHAVAHDGSAAYAEKKKIDGWIFSQIAGMVGQLAAAMEGDKSVLDNSAILTCNDMEEGASHSVDHIPFSVIGSCGGYLKTNQALHLNNQPHNLLLATLCNAMDVKVDGFGQKYMGLLDQIIA
jgi:hypothetical protein